MNVLRRLITPGWRPGRAALGGLLATIVYSVVMEGDKFLVGNRFSDVRFIEGLLVGTTHTKRTSLLAWLIHLLKWRRPGRAIQRGCQALVAWATLAQRGYLR